MPESKFESMMQKYRWLNDCDELLSVLNIAFIEPLENARKIKLPAIKREVFARIKTNVERIAKNEDKKQAYAQIYVYLMSEYIDIQMLSPRKQAQHCDIPDQLRRIIARSNLNELHNDAVIEYFFKTRKLQERYKEFDPQAAINMTASIEGIFKSAQE